MAKVIDIVLSRTIDPREIAAHANMEKLLTAHVASELGRLRGRCVQYVAHLRRHEPQLWQKVLDDKNFQEAVVLQIIKPRQIEPSFWGKMKTFFQTFL